MVCLAVTPYPLFSHQAPPHLSTGVEHYNDSQVLFVLLILFLCNYAAELVSVMQQPQQENMPGVTEGYITCNRTLMTDYFYHNFLF